MRGKREQVLTRRILTERDAEPLSPLEARLAGREALHRASQTSESVIAERRRGRVEVEARRISDAVTRDAQERLQAAERYLRAVQQEIAAVEEDVRAAAEDVRALQEALAPRPLAPPDKPKRSPGV